VWGELVDVSPMIDVVKLEEYFATKQTVKEISKPTNTPEKKNYLDSKRSQNIGQLPPIAAIIRMERYHQLWFTIS
jgi:hypothetical protein